MLILPDLCKFTITVTFACKPLCLLYLILSKFIGNMRSLSREKNFPIVILQD